MKIAIVTVCRDEDLYLDEWVNYHLNLGVDHIFIYDNNDKYGSIPDYGEKVTVSPFDIGDSTFGKAKIKMYKAAYDSIGSSYDWIAYIDVDEFITIPQFDIHDWLGGFGGNELIHLQWQCFGDSEKLSYEPGNVVDRFNVPALQSGLYLGKLANSYLKSIVRTNMKVISINEYTAVLKNGTCVNGDMTIGDMKSIYMNRPYTTGYIRHYITKSLEEYFVRKCISQRSVTDTLFKRPLQRMNEYFTFNKYTKEKQIALDALCDKYDFPWRYRYIIAPTANQFSFGSIKKDA